MNAWKVVRPVSMRRTLLVLLSIVFSAAAGISQPPARANADPGTIAYVRYNETTGDEIRLVEPDGSNDRLLWRTNKPDLPELYQVSALAWNPSASELAFASRGHSLKATDLIDALPRVFARYIPWWGGKP